MESTRAKIYSDQNNKGLDDSLNNSSNNETTLEYQTAKVLLVFISSLSSKYFCKM